jgi:hypothetical protein
MAVNKNKEDEVDKEDSEGFVASTDGTAWEYILRRNSVGFAAYHAFVTVQKSCDLVPGFSETLRKVIEDSKNTDLADRDLVRGIVENSPASKDSLEEAISKELRVLFGNAVQKEIGKMPSDKGWEEWLSKHNKRLELNTDNLTVEDFKRRREKGPYMSQNLRIKMLSALRKGEVIITDDEDVAKQEE